MAIQNDPEFEGYYETGLQGTDDPEPCHKQIMLWSNGCWHRQNGTVVPKAASRNKAFRWREFLKPWPTIVSGETPMKTYNLIVAAATMLDSRPDIREAEEAINKLLVASETGDLMPKEQIVDIDIESYPDVAMIRTSKGNHYSIPFSVLSADNPVEAARQWGHARRIESARDQVENLTQHLQLAEDALSKLMMQSTQSKGE